MGEFKNHCKSIFVADLTRFTSYNIGHLASRASDPLFAPCTPSAVIRLLESTGIHIQGSNAVVLGRSDIVGSPVAFMLRDRDSTVTQCHSRTKNIEAIVIYFNLILNFLDLQDRSKMLTFWFLLLGSQSL